MKRENDITPPYWAQRLLAFYCKPELLEDLQGDLHEYFQRNIKSKGKTKAKLIYIIDVLKFFRTYTIRKPEFLNVLIHLIMISSYIKTSGRSIMRNKLFSAINIIGLAISMSVGLLLISILTDVFSYDKFNDNHARIYRVISRYSFLGNRDESFVATTSIKVGKAIKESFTGIEDVAILRRDFAGDVTVGEKKIPLEGFWSNESVFNVLSFQLTAGNPASALKAPFSVVLTEESARKLFGNENAMGKTLVLKDREYTVTGIVQDIPRFSHVNFQMLGSLSTREITEKENTRELNWDNIWSTWVYVLMPEGADTKRLQQNLNKLSEVEDKTVKNTHIELSLQPLDEIMMADDLSNEIGPTIGRTTLWIFGALAFIVILSACFNYTNLSIARSVRRSREVGIRKTMGAFKSHLIGQFVIESIIIAFMALIVSIFIFILIKPHFIGMERSLQDLLVLELTPMLIGFFVVFAIFVGTVAGLFPALFFARINAVQVLKSITSVPVFQKLTMRKVLIVFQYAISIMLITATLIAYRQYKHFIAYDLGFSTANILNINMQENKADVLRTALYELPEVKQISTSQMVTSVGNYWRTSAKNPNNPQDSAFIYYNSIDEHYLPLHEHKLLAGRNFYAKANQAEESEVIVNESMLKRFNIGNHNPAKAIGEMLIVDGKNLTIVGVIEDFAYGRANSNGSKEVLFRYSTEKAEVLNVKVLSSDWVLTYAKIESIWKKLDPVHPLQAKFYNEQIEEAFRDLSAAIKMTSFISFLAICISSLGLLGMVVFTTETRLKEVSIRKVLGATEVKLLMLLGKSFFILLTIAAAVGLPVTYLVFDRLMLPEMPNHAPIGWFELFIGFFGIALVAVMMIATQTLKVARTNPAHVLRNE